MTFLRACNEKKNLEKKLYFAGGGTDIKLFFLTGDSFGSFKTFMYEFRKMLYYLLLLLFIYMSGAAKETCRQNADQIWRKYYFTEMTLLLIPWRHNIVFLTLKFYKCHVLTLLYQVDINVRKNRCVYIYR